MDPERKRMFTIPTSLRVVVAFLSNVLIAAIGPAVIESPFVRLVGLSDGAGVARRIGSLKADLLTITVALGLGYSVYRWWRPEAAKWIWLVGFLWFVYGAFLRMDGNHGAILWEASSTEFLDMLSAYRDFYNLNSFINWSEFTLPLLRTIFYSLGAFCCSRIGRYGPTSNRARSSEFR